MNVKFKMPKFGRQLTGKEWFKELLMTFLGTTISIVLTFGTSALLENREKAAIQRQTAIMSVYDIDEIIRLAKNERKKPFFPRLPTTCIAIRKNSTPYRLTP